MNESQVLIKRRGSIKSTYLNLSPVAYFDNEVRLSEAGRRLRSAVQSLLEEAGVVARVRIVRSGHVVPIVESLFWHLDGRTYLVLVANPSRQASVNSAGQMEFGIEAGEMTLSFSNPMKKIVNVRSGERIRAGQEVVIDWKPWEATVLEIAE